MHALLVAAVLLFYPVPAVMSIAEGEDRSTIDRDAGLAASFDFRRGEYLVGLGVQSGGRVLELQGAAFFEDPPGFDLGGGYRHDTLQVIGLYRQEAPARLSYVAVQRDVHGGLLIVDYTPSAPDVRLRLENELFVGRVRLQKSGEQRAWYDRAVATVDLLVDYESRVSVVGNISTLQLPDTGAGAYGVELAVPMQFHDRTILVAPRLLHSGLTRAEGHFSQDVQGYRFGDFSVGRLFGLLPGIEHDTAGTTAAVINAEYRHHFLRFAGLPILDGLFLSTFADGGVFGGSQQRAIVGDFTVGVGFGIDWGTLSAGIRAGYNQADRGFVWGLEIEDFAR